jgi:hypothetical protein
MAERPLGGLEFEHEFQSRDFPRLVYSLKERSHGGWPLAVARGRAWTKTETASRVCGVRLGRTERR